MKPLAGRRRAGRLGSAERRGQDLRLAAGFYQKMSLPSCNQVRGQRFGNAVNLMHSVAVVESGKKVYLVAIMSDVLKANSAVEHQAIAGEIERLVQGRRG